MDETWLNAGHERSREWVDDTGKGRKKKGSVAGTEK